MREVKGELPVGLNSQVSCKENKVYTVVGIEDNTIEVVWNGNMDEGIKFAKEDLLIMIATDWTKQADYYKIK